MGTRGLRIVKYKGRYWIFYNHWDSYLKGLGKALVEGILADSKEYQKWLQAQRTYYEKWDCLLHKILCIKPEDLASMHVKASPGCVWKAAFDESLWLCPPSYNPGSHRSDHSWIEYTYTIDLDLEIFSIDSSAHYQLGHIPRDDVWIEGLFLNCNNQRFVLPQCVPEESIGSLTVENEDLAADAMDYWAKLNTVEVLPRDESPSTVSGLRWRLFGIFSRSQLEHLSITLLGWTAQDLPFREIAFFILCIAAGGNKLALVDERRIIEPHTNDTYAGLVTGTDIDDERELISSVAAGYHVEGFPTGSALDESRYWFHGALICLVPRLNRFRVLEKAIADAVLYGPVHCCCHSFNAVLVSIEHVALVRSFPDGSVEYTDILPLISIKHSSKDAVETYGKRELRKFYDNLVEKPQESRTGKNDISDGTADQTQAKSKNEGPDQVGKDDIRTDEANMTTECPKPGDPETIAEHPNDNSDVIGSHEVVDVGSVPQDQEEVNVALQGQDEPKSELGSEAGKRDRELHDAEAELPHETQNIEDTEGKSQERKAAPEEEEITRSWTTEDTFNSLVQFFEATALEKLKPTKTGEQIVPVEIWEHILDYVSDVKTFHACTMVSRTLRSLCNQRPLVMDDLVFLKPRIDNPIINDEEENITSKHAKTDFRALQLSSGQQMGIKICSEQTENNGTACRIVVGSEKNRKSFCTDCPILLEGLEIPAPWDQNTQRSAHVPPAHTELEPEDRESVWNRAFGKCPITAESPSRGLGYFWKELFSAVANPSIDLRSKVYHAKRELEESADKGWEIPPNTIQYLATSQTSAFYKENFRYLFVRLKRGCEFWDTLWDDLIREATDYLGSPDHTAIGAHNPFVMLIVGLEVRLFKWDQGFDDDGSFEGGAARALRTPLMELDPGRLYCITEGKNREVIEQFLQTALNKEHEKAKEEHEKTEKRIEEREKAMKEYEKAMKEYEKAKEREKAKKEVDKRIEEVEKKIEEREKAMKEHEKAIKEVDKRIEELKKEIEKREKANKEQEQAKKEDE